MTVKTDIETACTLLQAYLLYCEEMKKAQKTLETIGAIASKMFDCYIKTMATADGEIAFETPSGIIYFSEIVEQLQEKL